jgi:hypothetical protein
MHIVIPECIQHFFLSIDACRSVAPQHVYVLVKPDGS